MPLIARLLAATLFLLLAACGGGGGGGGGGGSTSIAASATVVDLSVGINSGPYAKTLTISYRGDGVIVGIPPGATFPAWLLISQDGAATTTQARFSVGADPSGLPAGTYTTTLRFVTGRVGPDGDINNATEVRQVDVQVRLTVVDLGVSTQSISADAVDGAPVTRTGSVGVTASGGTAWSVRSTQPWLTLNRTSGSGSSSVGYTINTAGLASGTYTAYVMVTHTASGATVPVAVVLTIRAPLLTATPSPLAFSVTATTTAAQLSRTLTVSDELGGTVPARAATWHVAAISANWLEATPASGSSAPAQTVTVSLVPARLAQLANGNYSATLTLDYTASDGVARSLEVPVTLQLSQPRVQSVAPYLVSAQRQYAIIVRGSGFNGLGTAPVLFDGVPGTGVTVLSDQQLRVTYPALPAGVSNVSIPLALGTAPVATLRVQDDPVLPAATVALGGSKRRVFFDNERKVLYGVDTTTYRLDRIALQDGSWVALSPITVPGNLRDAAISPDGRTLVMVSENLCVYELDLTTPGALVQQAATGPTDSWSLSYYLFRSIAFANNGVAVITTGIRGSGYTTLYTYKQATHTLLGAMPVNYVYSGNAFASADGSNLLVLQNGLSPPPAVVAYDPDTNSAYETPLHGNQNSAVMSRDGNVVVLDGQVMDRAFAVRGSISSVTIAVSPDGSRAYAYVYDSYTGNPKQVDIYDLTTPSAGSFAKLGSLPLDPTIRAPGAYGQAFAISDDGKTLFVWGSAKTLVMPLP